MRSGTLATLVLALIVIGTGCSGLPLDRTSGNDTRTVNPMLEGTPSITPTATSRPEYPPGIDADNVNPETLARAHESTLSGQSYAHRTRQTVVTDNGTVLGNVTLVVRIDEPRRFVSYAAGGVDPTAVGLGDTDVDYWTNGTTAVERRISPNGSVSYDPQPGGLGVFFDPTAQARIEGALRGANATVAGTTDVDGRTLYVLRDTVDRIPRGTGPDGRNITLEMVVTERGLVQSYYLQFETIRSGRNVTVTVQFELLDAENTTVERPAWYDAATNTSRRTSTPG